jgi:hypothetical protein
MRVAGVAGRIEECTTMKTVGVAAISLLLIAIPASTGAAGAPRGSMRRPTTAAATMRPATTSKPVKCDSTTDPRPAWKRVVAWTKKHAPKDYAQLKRGATKHQIAVLQRGLHRHVPTELRQWLEQNNGAVNGLENMFPYDNEMLGSNGILSNYRIDLSINSKHYTAWPKDWIPVLLAIDGSQDYLYTGPGPRHGCIYDYDFEDGPPGDLDFTGLATMLGDLDRWMHRGVTNEGWKLVIHHGLMDWNPPSH